MKNTYVICAVMALSFMLALQVASAQTNNTMNMSWMLPNSTASAGFLNGSEMTFIYTRQFTCTPPTNQLFANSSEVANSLKVTRCEVGVQGNQTNSDPQWIIIPAYAGLSIFGPQLGGSPEGFPIYANSVVVTQCGVSGTAAQCPEHPANIYSPLFTAVERYLNITNGALGLPEGVLPLPAHSHIIYDADNGSDANWYTISVFVLDPNIMPNGTNGACREQVPSNLSNPSGNCLTSISALARALSTRSSSVAAANQKNPIWNVLGQPDVQVIIPNDTTIGELNNSNSNVNIPFIVKDYGYYKTQLVKLPAGYLALVGGVVGVIVIISLASFWIRDKKKKSDSKKAA